MPPNDSFKCCFLILVLLLFCHPAAFEFQFDPIEYSKTRACGLEADRDVWSVNGTLKIKAEDSSTYTTVTLRNDVNTSLEACRFSITECAAKNNSFNMCYCSSVARGEPAGHDTYTIVVKEKNPMREFSELKLQAWMAPSEENTTPAVGGMVVGEAFPLIYAAASASCTMDGRYIHLGPVYGGPLVQPDTNHTVRCCAHGLMAPLSVTLSFDNSDTGVVYQNDTSCVEANMTSDFRKSGLFQPYITVSVGYQEGGVCNRTGSFHGYMRDAEVVDQQNAAAGRRVDMSQWGGERSRNLQKFRNMFHNDHQMSEYNDREPGNGEGEFDLASGGGTVFGHVAFMIVCVVSVIQMKLY